MLVREVTSSLWWRLASCDNAKEHNGVIEIGVDAKIVPTHRNQIEEKWKEEIKTKMTDVRLEHFV